MTYRADAGRRARSALGPDRREPGRGSVARRRALPRRRCAAFRAAISPRPTASPPPPSIWPPTARSRPGATTPRSTSPSARCTRSTCRRSAPRSPPASPRSCRPSTDLAGVPMTANASLLRDLVRGRWGFEGVIVSDYGAVAELVVHGVAADLAEAAALALRAGRRHRPDGQRLRQRPARGARARAGRDDRYRCRGHARPDAQGTGSACSTIPIGAAGARGRSSSPRIARLAREAARRAIVLLTNRGGMLPLAPGGGAIAVIGPLADARRGDAGALGGRRPAGGDGDASWRACAPRSPSARSRYAPAARRSTARRPAASPARSRSSLERPMSSCSASARRAR